MPLGVRLLESGGEAKEKGVARMGGGQPPGGTWDGYQGKSSNRRPISLDEAIPVPRTPTFDPERHVDPRDAERARHVPLPATPGLTPIPERRSVKVGTSPSLLLPGQQKEYLREEKENVNPMNLSDAFAGLTTEQVGQLVKNGWVPSGFWGGLSKSNHHPGPAASVV